MYTVSFFEMQCQKRTVLKYDVITILSVKWGQFGTTYVPTWVSSMHYGQNYQLLSKIYEISFYFKRLIYRLICKKDDIFRLQIIKTNECKIV